MLHLLYVIAFTILAVLAISNLIRNLVVLGSDARQFSNGSRSGSSGSSPRPVTHPELLDSQGNVISEPLLVMRSISLKDAREQLDALYESSSSAADDSTGDNRPE